VKNANCEIKVLIKDEEGKKLTVPFNLYETVVMDPDHPILKECIDDALKQFPGEPEDIIVSAKMYLK
jgi:hypothetical protein